MKAYFKRNWKREDLMNSGEITLHAHKSLKKVYLTLFCAMLSFTFGSFLHLIWEAGGLFTVLSSVAFSLWLYFTPPWRAKNRVILLMFAAYSFGASIGLFTKYLFEIEQGLQSCKERGFLLIGYIFVIPLSLIIIRSTRYPNWKIWYPCRNYLLVSLLAGSTIGIGTFWFGAMMTRKRSEIYIGCLLYSCVLMFSSFVVNAFDILDSHTAHWMIKVYTLLTLFMGYYVLYSQDILYNARYGDINFVNCTFTVFFRLPAIVVHAARVYLGAKIQQHRQN